MRQLVRHQVDVVLGLEPGEVGFGHQRQAGRFLAETPLGQEHLRVAARGRPGPRALAEEGLRGSGLPERRCVTGRRGVDGQAALRRRGERRGGEAPEVGLHGLLLLEAEAARRLLRIESDRVGIGTHETQRVGGPGKIAEAAFLDGLEVAWTDAQLVRNVVEVAFQREPHLAQRGAELERLGIASARRA